MILMINSVVLKHLTVQNSSQKSRHWFPAMSKFHSIQNINQYKSENPNLLIQLFAGKIRASYMYMLPL